MSLIAEQLVITQIVQKAAREEGFITESEIQAAACLAVERIFERVELKIQNALRAMS